MILTNPWGLLALLSIPVIVGLHFFRDRRRVQRVGGLHFWHFARTHLPVGRRFDRLIRNLPLLFQLLAALLLSLLIAGLDLPHEDSSRHYTLLVDTSASMLAGGAESPAARARALVEKWAQPDDRFTLVAAGLKPRILAGPFATQADLLAAIRTWKFEDPGCDVDAAIGLAGKFLTGDEKMLFLTDDVTPLKGWTDRIEVAAFGQPLENSAIHFADRVRIAPDRDRVFVTLRGYVTTDRDAVLRVTAGEREIFNKTMRLEPEKLASLSFETSEIASPLDLSLDADALEADNRAGLAPVAVKTVRVSTLAMGESKNFVERVIQALPNTAVAPEATQADLVISAAWDYQPTAQNRRVVQFPFLRDEETSKTQPSLAEGRGIVIDPRQAAMAGLSLEGVLWPYQGDVTPPGQPLLSAAGHVLMTFESRSGRQAFYHFNLLWDRTNLFRQAAWPILAQGIIEECRDAIPGMDRTNFRAGESVVLNVEPGAGLANRFELKRDGEAIASYETPPEALTDLTVGDYALVQDGQADLARFRVNLFAPGESDLRAVAPNTASLEALVANRVNRTETNKALFLGLVMLTILMTGLSWIFQDISQ
ncbi:MAG TPA: BatA and WFA domain-containing protein [Candidatus Sumerlaeota bacterium]|mgnify:CR=1 FL=1|nr:BatA and WFA domain-containing protein [Candidatus Sumerlaeota bacterium]